MPNTVVKTQGLAKTYRTGFWMRPVVGLLPLDIEVHEGEIFGFIGPNGAGKTTTIKILMGLQAATGGTATLFGKSYEDPSSRENVGFLPERPYFYEHLSGAEILDFYGGLLGVPKDVRRERSATLLERVNLTRFADVPLRKYSKGMLQRVGLCQALINDPKLLVLDEPMSGLDPIGRALVKDIILEERERGRTVFFSSHILHDVEVMSDRVAIVVQGQLQGIGTMDQLIKQGEKLVDLTYTGVSAIEGDERRNTLGAITTRIPEARVNEALQSIISGGGVVVQVTPVRETLEDLLLSEVERNKAVDKKSLAVLA